MVLAIFSPVVLQASQTSPGDEASTGLSLPRGDAPHQRQLHLCSVSLFRETEGKDSSRQTYTVALLAFFRPSDIPFFYSFLQRNVFYLLSLLQLQEHLGPRSDRSFWAATFSKPPAAQLQPSLSCKCDNCALGACSGVGQGWED